MRPTCVEAVAHVVEEVKTTSNLVVDETVTLGVELSIEPLFVALGNVTDGRRGTIVEDRYTLDSDILGTLHCDYLVPSVKEECGTVSHHCGVVTISQVESCYIRTVRSEKYTLYILAISTADSFKLNLTSLLVVDVIPGGKKRVVPGFSRQ